MTDNDRLAKWLGWHNRNVVGEWYSTPDGGRQSEPPAFESDESVWLGSRGAIAGACKKAPALFGAAVWFEVREDGPEPDHRTPEFNETVAAAMTATPLQLKAALLRVVDQWEDDGG